MSDPPVATDSPASPGSGPRRTFAWRKEIGDLRIEAGVRYSQILPSGPPEETLAPPAGVPLLPRLREGGEPRRATSQAAGDAKPLPDAITRWENEGGAAF